MRMVSAEQGQEAIRQINEIHGHNVGLREGYVASYLGSGNEASVWVARMASPAEARSLVDQMTERIRPNKPYFTDLQQVQKEGSQMNDLHHDYAGPKHLPNIAISWLNDPSAGVNKLGFNDILRLDTRVG